MQVQYRRRKKTFFSLFIRYLSRRLSCDPCAEYFCEDSQDVLDLKHGNEWFIFSLFSFFGCDTNLQLFCTLQPSSCMKHVPLWLIDMAGSCNLEISSASPAVFDSTMKPLFAHWGAESRSNECKGQNQNNKFHWILIQQRNGGSSRVGGGERGWVRFGWR